LEGDPRTRKRRVVLDVVGGGGVDRQHHPVGVKFACPGADPHVLCRLVDGGDSSAQPHPLTQSGGQFVAYRRSTTADMAVQRGAAAADERAQPSCRRDISEESQKRQFIRPATEFGEGDEVEVEPRLLGDGVALQPGAEGLPVESLRIGVRPRRRSFQPAGGAIQSPDHLAEVGQREP
jgi:hypothetical protein